MNYDAKIINGTDMKSETFEDLARALDNPWLPDNTNIPKEYRTISITPEELLEHEDIIISSNGTLRPSYEFESSLPWNFEKYLESIENTSGNNLKRENAILYIMPGHLDGPQIYVLDEERTSPDRRLNFNGKRSYLFGRRPEEPSGILEKINPFLEKKGTMYVAASMPERNYEIRNTKIWVDKSIARLHGAIISNAEDVSIVNLGASPIFVYLKKRDVEPVMLRI